MATGPPAHVLIVGGGGTGGALAHDLALRGLKVTLVERGELTSGTTGRHHGLLHSGARYAVNDHDSAVECIEENKILRRIAPGSFEENDGLFVAIDDDDMDYLPQLLSGCEASGIPTQVLTPAEALRLEPMLNPDLKAAVRVPDATMDAMRMPMRFFATAQANGAELLNYAEVVGVLKRGGLVNGVAVHDHVTEGDAEIHADLVVNATGPWSEKVATLAGVDVPIRPSPGVMLALRGRLCNMVVNHLHRSGDGDIVVPQRGLSVVGTSSWVVEDPDELDVPQDHVQRMYEEGAKLIPAA
jgi:glycerol-3-phosphate dehydrogenase